MYSKKDFGFSADFLKTVASVMSKNRNMTVSEIQEKLDSGVWSADTPILEGKEALIYDRQLNRRISVNVISEAMDPVNKKALKKDFDDREDKDIDNDGDTDDSDEYLHKRRKAISKAMKDEAMKPYVSSDKDGAHVMNSKGKAVKTFKDMKSANAYLEKNFKSLSEDEDLEEAKNYEIKNDKIHISKANFRKVHKDYKNVTKGKESMLALDPKTGATTSFQVVFTEDADLEEAKKVTKKQLRDLEDRNEHGLVALKLAQSFGTPAEVKKIQDINKRHDMKGDIEYKDQKERDAIASKYWKMAEEVDLEEAEQVVTLPKGVGFYDTTNYPIGGKFDRVTDSNGLKVTVKRRFKLYKGTDTEGMTSDGKKVAFQMRLAKEDADLEEGKKGYKKESDDSSNDEKMTDAQKNDMDGDGDKDKKGKKKNDKEKVDSIDTDPEMSDTMVQERAGEKLASYEREKLDDLKKKHEGGKMHRALRRQYGDKGDEIFYGKLTKMAKGEYDGSQSKSEEFQLTAEDLNTLDELQRLGQQFDEARGRPPKGDDADDAGSKNFVMQMRKSVSLRGQNTVTFDDGSKMKVDQRKAQTFLNRFMDLKKPAEKEMLMKSASKSPKHFDMALQGKVAKDSKPSMLPPLKSEK